MKRTVEDTTFTDRLATDTPSSVVLTPAAASKSFHAHTSKVQTNVFEFDIF